MASLRLPLCLMAAGAFALAACTTEDYDTGDSHYSYLRADFGMLHTAAQQRADYLLTDDGKRIVFSEPAKVTWATRADTLYRALTYHDVNALTVFSTSRVPVIQPALRDTLHTIDIDPMAVESLWKGGGYLNIGFAVKSGIADSIDTRQTVGIIRDSLTTDRQGHKTLHLTMRHAQNGVPEYYTVRGYLSMHLPDTLADATIRLTTNTYNGGQTMTR